MNMDGDKQILPIRIRSVLIDDFAELYEIGKTTPEFRVSATEDFMDVDEFKWSITNPDGIFLVAEERNKKIGFIYANAKDMERPFEHKYACLVYLVVMSEFRGQKTLYRMRNKIKRNRRYKYIRLGECRNRGGYPQFYEEKWIFGRP